MSSETNKKVINPLTWIIASLFFLGLGCLCFWIHRMDSKNDYVMSIIGSLCSLFGLLIAIIQIIKATKASLASQNAAEMAKKAVDDNIQELNKYLSYSSISQCEKLVDEIEALIHAKKHDRLLVRLKELKDSIIDIRNNTKLEQYIKNCNKDFSYSVMMLQTDIDAVGKMINNKKNAVDFDVIFTHVENIKTDLTEIASKLKYMKL